MMIDEMNLDPSVRPIIDKIQGFERITTDEALVLYHKVPLGILGQLATHWRQKYNQQNAYYIKNIHIEPTNLCAFDCLFCSYKSKSHDDAWELTNEEITKKLAPYTQQDICEVHIVGGAHPKNPVSFYTEMVRIIREQKPWLHIKGFSAVELVHMFRISKMSYTEGLQALKDAGLNSIPGGGAEIFDEEIRKQICGTKATSQEWLDIHRTTHSLGLFSNATILYGHLETIEHRIEHMNRLRELQDETHGFKAFIPLKYRNQNNKLSHIKEVTLLEDLRMYAISRIFLDNFEHIKAYWPMLGKKIVPITLSFGADDLDGTINDSTVIYSKAGSEETSPNMTSAEIQEIIINAGFVPMERNSAYEII